jgi:transcriptional regulator with XRE-family HTH domain
MNVVNLKSKPQVFDTPERVMSMFADKIHAERKTYKQIASEMGISPSTVASLARGRTRWPRPHTFMALLRHFNLQFRIE